MDQMLSGKLEAQINRSKSSTQGKTDFLARNHVIGGRFLVKGVGVVVKELNFPVNFIEEPLFYSGGVLEDNQTIGDVPPEVHAIVISWNVENVGSSGKLYKGCRLNVYTKGANDQRMWVNWHMSANALVNPVSGMTGTDVTL